MQGEKAGTFQLTSISSNQQDFCCFPSKRKQTQPPLLPMQQPHLSVVSVCVCVSIFLYIYLHMHVCVYLFVFASVCVFACVSLPFPTSPWSKLVPPEPPLIRQGNRAIQDPPSPRRSALMRVVASGGGGHDKKLLDDRCNYAHARARACIREKVNIPLRNPARVCAIN